MFPYANYWSSLVDCLDLYSNLHHHCMTLILDHYWWKKTLLQERDMLYESQSLMQADIDKNDANGGLSAFSYYQFSIWTTLFSGE